MIEGAQDWRWLLYALLVIAAIGDIRSLRIPNILPIAIVATLVVALMATAAPPDDFVKAATSGLIGLAIGYGLFAARLMGGGDGKLFAAAAAWFSAEALLSVGLWISIAGIVVALAALVVRSLRRASRSDAVETPTMKTPIPYGVAIAAGVIIAAHVPIASMVAS